MCGICGVLDYSGSGRVDRPGVEAMSRMLTHRGPDDSGFYWDDHVGLAHRRLSVIDISGGSQPMSNEDGSVWVVYNGEIYNFPELRAGLEKKGHLFRTASDTEVIVHLYEEHGPGAVELLNGMFAFALWDKAKARLVLARDRLGIKPLYYTENGGRLYFSSELRPLVAASGIRATVSEASLCRYLLLQYTPGPGTMLEGVNKLPPGSVMVAGGGSSSTSSYWTPELYRDGRESGSGLPERLLAALDGSVKRQLVSDVPLGAFLSGGIDSSAAVAIMRKHRPGLIKTFSLGFEGPSAFDERGYARSVSGRLGTEHYETSLSPANFAELMPVVVGFMDEPVADPAAVPTFKLSKLAREHVTVVMTGEGGDELFGGYRRYLLEHRAGGMAAGPLSGWLARAVSGISGTGRKYQKALRALSSEDWAEAHLNWVTVFLEEELEGLAPGTCVGGWDNTRALFANTPGGSSGRLSRMMACDLRTWLVDDLLAKVDRMSMAVSLEARVPYLDNEVLDIALLLSESDRIRGGRTKYVLKEAVRGLLSDDVIERGKKGFDLPLSDWFRGPLRDYIYDSLAGDPGGACSLLDSGFIGRMLEEHTSGRRDWALPLFSVLTFRQWAERTGV